VDFELLTPAETAAILKVGRERVYTLVRKRILPAVHLGRHIRVSREALEQFIATGGKSLPGGWRKEPE
jgi:excisionase family DNA binding protein